MTSDEGRTFIDKHRGGWLIEQRPQINQACFKQFKFDPTRLCESPIEIQFILAMYMYAYYHEHQLYMEPQVDCGSYRLDVYLKIPIEENMFYCYVECDGKDFHITNEHLKSDMIRDRFVWDDLDVPIIRISGSRLFSEPFEVSRSMFRLARFYSSLIKIGYTRRESSLMLMARCSDSSYWRQLK
jgi:hypothetical protein